MGDTVSGREEIIELNHDVVYVNLQIVAGKSLNELPWPSPQKYAKKLF